MGSRIQAAGACTETVRTTEQGRSQQTLGTAGQGKHGGGKCGEVFRVAGSECGELIPGIGALIRDVGR